MQLKDKAKISTNNPTLNHLIIELSEECQKAIALTNQLQLSDLTDRQKVEILAELLATTIHFHSHCDEDFQNLIAEELENLDDTV
ncbi:MAG: hypothetical protein AB4290_27910 [Spirulina sp.]